MNCKIGGDEAGGENEGGGSHRFHRMSSLILSISDYDNPVRVISTECLECSFYQREKLRNPAG
ncbi:MAG: hypothetical protein D3914_10775 [Candidatus Electrothrix sp. LOE2]|nr:hypothetical protein [Candidatus Electrothrix sp. LOE2]